VNGHLYLVGMMGSGKTTTGRRLATALDRPFLDSDEAVERATGKTVREIFASEGEAAFRAAERGALEEAAALGRASVVAVAGGAVLDPANRDLLRRSGSVVWLRAMPSTLAQRVGDGAGRPLLDGNPPQVLAELDAVRRPLYAELADHVVDVEDLSPSEVSEEILGWLAGAESNGSSGPAIGARQAGPEP